MRLLFLAVIASIAILASLVVALPLAETNAARWAHSNSPSPLHTLALSQPSSDLNPRISLLPSFESMDTVQAGTNGGAGVEKRYAGQARFFESPNDRSVRRGRESRLFEYLS
ncbi:uncharacterized protein UTRI_05583 [Ustilago trichophora]|uniref:Uncharacterized protein n=1 Tax=Ustilago trichophora TaxID=86804 RepID=A0A5C3EJR5_9BASI|nr:uncharacterized protein UTRI_05583 [Ustilago trichophora]